MNLTLYEKCRKKQLLKQYTIIAFAIALFYAAVCTPVFIQGKTNVMLINSIFPIIWDVVMTAVNYIFYWVSFAYVLYFIAYFSLQNCKGILGIYLGVSLFLYSANLLSSLLTLNDFSAFRLNDLWDIAMYVLFDTLHMAAVVLIGSVLLLPIQKRAIRARSVALKKDPNAKLNLPKWLPFGSFFDLKNELMRSAFFASAISAGIHIFSRIVYDLFFGEPAGTADLLWMISAYISEILALIAGYLVIIFILNQLFFQEERKRNNYEAALQKLNKQD